MLEFFGVLTKCQKISKVGFRYFFPKKGLGHDFVLDAWFDGNFGDWTIMQEGYGWTIALIWAMVSMWGPLKIEGIDQSLVIC